MNPVQQRMPCGCLFWVDLMERYSSDDCCPGRLTCTSCTYGAGLSPMFCSLCMFQKQLCAAALSGVLDSSSSSSHEQTFSCRLSLFSRLLQPSDSIPRSTQNRIIYVAGPSPRVCSTGQASFLSTISWIQQHVSMLCPAMCDARHVALLLDVCIMISAVGILLKVSTPDPTPATLNPRPKTCKSEAQARNP